MNFQFKCKVLDGEKNKKIVDNLLDYLKAFLVELVGTLLLSFFGCACFLEGKNAIGQSLCFAFTYGSIMMIFMLIDLAQINPAVTLCYYIFGIFSLPKMFVYIIAQILGSIFGAQILKAITSDYDKAFGGQCITSLQDNSVLRGFGWEFGLTCFLILFVCSIIETKNAGGLDGFPLKMALLSIFPLKYIGMYYTGTAMNPALYLGCAFAAKMWKHIWVYLIAPLLASALMSVAFHILFLPKDGQDNLREIIKEETSVKGDAE